MGYDAVHRNFDNNRAAFITAGRNHLIHALCMNHHRISWSVLRGALNQVMSGKADDKLLNILISPSPATGKPDMLKKFKAAMQQAQAGKTLAAAQVIALETVEGEVFSLPLNLFQGLNARYDDPQDKMDFTPDDIAYNGARVTGNLGDLQKIREQNYSLLGKTTIDLISVETAFRDWAKLWQAHGGGLAAATPYNAAWWSPGGPPFAIPGYRHWVNPTTNTPLTNDEAKALNEIVLTRATTKF